MELGTGRWKRFISGEVLGKNTQIHHTQSVENILDIGNRNSKFTEERKEKDG